MRVTKVPGIANRTGIREPHLHTLAPAVEKIGLVSAFLEGTIGEYIKTAAGKEEIREMARNPALFERSMEALKIPGAIYEMTKFLTTKEGIEAYVTVCKEESGLRMMIKFGQTPEGREVALGMIKHPTRWVALFKILWRLSKEAVSVNDAPEQKVSLPNYDLSALASSRNPAKDMLHLLGDQETLKAIFASFSYSDKNTKLCGIVLEDSRIRSIFFQYLVNDPEETNNLFRNLFQSADRRRRTVEIFKSNGGTALLVDLAANVNGRTIMTELAITNSGRRMGLNVLLHHPSTILRVGKAYFAQPKNAQEVSD